MSIVGAVLMLELVRRSFPKQNINQQASISAKSHLDEQWSPCNKVVSDAGSTTDADSTRDELSSSCCSSDVDSETESEEPDVAEWQKIGARMAISLGDSDADDVDGIDVAEWQKIGARLTRSLASCISSSEDSQ